MHEIILPTFGMPEHTALMIYIMAGMGLLAYVMSTRLKLVPGKLQSVIEIVVELFMGMGEEAMGHKGRKYLPLIVTFAFFIFISNMLGLLPGFLPPTANLNTTAGLAMAVFFATHVIGLKENGIKYLKHFIGPVWWLAPLMIPIEIIGHLARPLSLSLRLFGNMMGHEQIVGVLLILMPVAYPLLALSTALGVVVALIQSFVFSLLAMMYIGGALEEAH